MMEISKKGRFLIATDLDGTFLGGDELSKEKLYLSLTDKPEVILVFVTGRGLKTVTPLFETERIPRPDFIICDVGATIVYGNSLEPVNPIQDDIEIRWPGADKVNEAFGAVKGLRYQEVPQQRRSSWYFDENTDLGNVSAVAEDLSLDIIISHGKYVDVLPQGINKGSTLKNLIELLGQSDDSILVAGDTLNDLSLFKTGYKGVVVGDAEEELVNLTRNMKNIFHATSPGTGGILQALEHFDIKY